MANEFKLRRIFNWQTLSEPIKDDANSSGGAIKSKKITLTNGDISTNTGVNFDIAVEGKIIVPLYAVIRYAPGTVPYSGGSQVKIIPSVV